jgi:eukaryotic-like serine/threonine-protein kinase
MMPNSRIGHYAILAPLGRGGMGEVYRAHDSKLGRDVAVKILPEPFTADVERRTRFAREARTLATLNHPNIGAIYGLEEADGVTALVLELVEGPTLAARLEQGPLPAREAVVIARQIAHALAAAHEHGIVHRDLKPANIVLRDGQAKVLDFGLAKSLAPSSSDGPTISAAGASDGLIVGTPAYMSPEQARGQAVDARTDVWAFGCVLYEMIAGRRAFHGATTSDTIARILEHDPDWTGLPASTPPGIRRVLKRCLEKDLKRRLHAIADVIFDLDESLHDGQAVAAARPARRSWLPLVVTAAVVTAGAAVGWQVWSARGGAVPAPRVLPLTSYPGIEASPTFSPDGKQVAFSWDGGHGGEGGEHYDIYVVLVGSDSPLQLTNHPARDVSPAWKPDGSQIAFARLDAGRAGIYLVSPLGRSERKIADFLAAPAPNDGPIETSDPRLSWSPDGRWLVVTRVTSDGREGIFLVADDGTIRMLVPAKTTDTFRMAVFAPRGDALAVINGSYLEVAGLQGMDPPALNGALRRQTPYLGAVSGLAWTSDGKSLLFGRAPYASPNAPSVWRASAFGAPAMERVDVAGVAAFPAVSASASRLAFVRRGLNTDLFMLSEGRAPEPVMVSTSNEQDVSVSPDGSKIAFASDRIGEAHEIWIAPTNDPASRRSLTGGAHRPEGAPRWSRDGKWLAFDGLGEDGQRHVYIVDEAGGAIRVLPTRPGFDERLPSWSRDGSWIYYGSNRTGRLEIWRARAGGGEPEQITTTGGDAPFESDDGRLLYYYRVVDGRRTVFARSFADGSERRLDVTVAFWNYCPGPGGLYYLTPRQGQRPPYTFEVRFLDVATGRSRTLHTVRLAGASPGLSVMPDGKTILMAGAAEITQDLVRIDNFR